MPVPAIAFAGGRGDGFFPAPGVFLLVPGEPGVDGRVLASGRAVVPAQVASSETGTQIPPLRSAVLARSASARFGPYWT